MLKINGKEVIFESFPNGEVRLPTKDIRTTDNKVANILWKYKDDSDIIKLIFLTNELKDYAHQIHLTITYMPYSRMDRTEQIYTFTLRHTANIINSLGFDSVRVIDPHSDVTCALLERSTAKYPLIETIENMHENSTNAILFFPDNGAHLVLGGVAKICRGCKQRAGRGENHCAHSQDACQPAGNLVHDSHFRQDDRHTQRQGA